MPLAGGIETRTNGAHSLVHRKRSGGRHSTAEQQRACALIWTAAFVSRTVEDGSVAFKIRSQQATVGISEQVRIEFVGAAAPRPPGTPVMARNSVSVVGIGRKKIAAVPCIESQGSHQLSSIIQAIDSLALLFSFRKGRQ